MIDATDAAMIAEGLRQIRAWLIGQDQSDATVAELISSLDDALSAAIKLCGERSAQHLGDESDLLTALDVAWIAASRLRLERNSVGLDDSAPQEGFV